MSDRPSLFPPELRTFETRLQYISNVFSNKYEQDEILKSCIQHKLNISFENYLHELEKSFNILENKSPEKVFRKID